MSKLNKKVAIKTNLYASPAPLEWCIVSPANAPVLYTAQIPIDDKGQVVSGGIEAQTKKVFDNLVDTLESANSTTDDVLQVLIYVTDREYLKVVNEIYKEYFNAPYPNRGAFVISGLAREEMLVEIIVYAHCNNIQ